MLISDFRWVACMKLHVHFSGPLQFPAVCSGLFLRSGFSSLQVNRSVECAHVFMVLSGEHINHYKNRFLFVGVGEQICRMCLWSCLMSTYIITRTGFSLLQGVIWRHVSVMSWQLSLCVHDSEYFTFIFFKEIDLLFVSLVIALTLAQVCGLYS